MLSNMQRLGNADIPTEYPGEYYRKQYSVLESLPVISTPAKSAFYKQKTMPRQYIKTLIGKVIFPIGLWPHVYKLYGPLHQVWVIHFTTCNQM